MNYFLKRTLIFITIPVISTIILVIIFSDILPAPKITDRYSFNEKVFHFDDFECDYLCIGSSMALNNFDSDEIVDELSTTNYFNFACWGVKPTDNYFLLKVYLSKYNPKYIFFVSNVMDFLRPVYPLNENQIKLRILYPNKFFKPFYYLTHLDLKYYYKYFELNKLNKFTDTINESLLFDEYGGVLLVANDIPHVSTPYWNIRLEFDQIVEENYDYLDSTLRLLTSKNINFIFIQTPLREGLIDKEYRVNINNHNNKVKTILDKYDQLYINATEIIWPDTMFFDYGHFHKQGAKVFTNYCLNKFKEHYRFDINNDQNLQSKGVTSNDTIVNLEKI